MRLDDLDIQASIKAKLLINELQPIINGAEQVHHPQMVRVALGIQEGEQLTIEQVATAINVLKWLIK